MLSWLYSAEVFVSLVSQVLLPLHYMKPTVSLHSINRLLFSFQCVHS